jgi:hypothetical protein
MIDENQVIKKYIEADCEHRLTLFLNHPPLRNRFIDIDLNEKRRAGGKSKGKMLLKSFFGLNSEEL